MRIGLALVALCWLAKVPAAVEVTGEFLYLRPSFCNAQYAILSADSADIIPNGPVQEVYPSYEAGFRLGVGYLECDSRYDIAVHYTRLYQGQSARTASGADQVLFPVYAVGLPFALTGGTAEARTKFALDSAEVQVAHRSIHDPGFLCLRAWAGLRYAYLRRPLEIHYEGSQPTVTNLTSTVRTQSRVWGIGPMLGVNLRLDPLHCVGIGGAFSLGLLTGDRHLDFYQFQQADANDPQIVNLAFGRGVAFFPVVMARLGLNTCWCCSCFTTLFEVGYEFTDYLRALERVNCSGTEGGSLCLLCEDARIDGLYVSMRVGF